MIHVTRASWILALAMAAATSAATRADDDDQAEPVAHPNVIVILTDDQGYANALCRSYNRWIKQVCDQRPDRLQWVCTVNLGDVDGAIAELRRARQDGALGCMMALFDRQRTGVGAARGIEITVTIDEKAFEGSGIFLLGAVLDRFFAEYSAFNHFTQTVIRSVERGEIMRWPARMGTRQPL